MKIIKDIVRGERDPLKLAKHRHASCKRTEDEIASALYGNWRSELLFALKQALKLYELMNDNYNARPTTTRIPDPI
jgi:hypothetical protein